MKKNIEMAAFYLKNFGLAKGLKNAMLKYGFDYKNADIKKFEQKKLFDTLKMTFNFNDISYDFLKKGIDSFAAAYGEPCGVITALDNEYEILKDYEHAPAVLFYAGNLSLLNNQKIGIVGSRRAGSYGRTYAFNIAYDLSSQNITVVSGFAVGIDAQGHSGALGGNGKTIAVLGCGLNINYPVSNYSLKNEILKKGGLLLTEYPFDFKPQKYSFPKRNYLISALSDALVVVEAPEKSGSLITADFTLSMGKDICVLPARANDINFRGSNNLIRQGAYPIERASDIYGLVYGGECLFNNASLNLTRDESKIVEALNGRELNIDELIASTSFDMASLYSLLFRLEAKGAVKSRGNNYFLKKEGL